MNSSLRAQLRALALRGALGQRATRTPVHLHSMPDSSTPPEPQKDQTPCPDTASASPSTT